MRQFIAPSFPDQQGLLAVSGKDYRHMHQVLRVRCGDMIAVRLPDGTLQHMTVCTVDEKARTVILPGCAVQNAPVDPTGTGSTLSGVEFWLFQCMARPQKMDDIVRQATECGVACIVPVISEYTQSAYAEAGRRNERLSRIIKEARQQSGSPVDTRCLEPVTFSGAMDMWRDLTAQDDRNAVAFALYERTDMPESGGRGAVVSAVKRAAGRGVITHAALLVGNEGGISPAEIEYACSRGFLPVHFATNILRCETAALYGLAVVQSIVVEE